MVFTTPIKAAEQSIPISATTIASGDSITYSYSVDNNACYSGAFTKNTIRNETELIEGQHLYIKKVLYQNPATIVSWSDGTKTVSKCSKKDVYSLETGFTPCVLKKIIGTREVRILLQEWCSYESSAYGLKSVTVADIGKKYKEDGNF